MKHEANLQKNRLTYSKSRSIWNKLVSTVIKSKREKIAEANSMFSSILKEYSALIKWVNCLGKIPYSSNSDAKFAYFKDTELIWTLAPQMEGIQCVVQLKFDFMRIPAQDQETEEPVNELHMRPYFVPSYCFCLLLMNFK